MEASNKLIAEFMGVKTITSDELYSILRQNREDGFIHTPQAYTIDELQYHTSWDWLIPVVSKCFKTGDDTHQWDNIMDTMFTCDISIVYAQVVQFIKNQNN